MTALAKQIEQTPIPQSDPDAADVRLAQRGDASAFERLYRRHAAKMNSLADWTLGGTRADSEDALQDIFIRAWEKLGTFRGQSAFGTWLHRLGVNVLLRRRESTRTRQRRYVVDDQAMDAAPARRSGLELWTDIETAVSALPPRMRDVFVLHDMEGYKHDEIATMLGITAGTARSQLHHARMTLRKHLE